MLNELVLRFTLSDLGQSAHHRLVALGLSPEQAEASLTVTATAALTTALPATASSRLGAALRRALELPRSEPPRQTLIEPLATSLAAKTGLSLALASAAVSISLPEVFLFLRSRAR